MKTFCNALDLGIETRGGPSKWVGVTVFKSPLDWTESGSKFDNMVKEFHFYKMIDNEEPQNLHIFSSRWYKPSICSCTTVRAAIIENKSTTSDKSEWRYQQQGSKQFSGVMSICFGPLDEPKWNYFSYECCLLCDTLIMFWSCRTPGARKNLSSSKSVSDCALANSL